MGKKVLLDHVTMTGILHWLENEHKVKKSGEPFTLQDVQGYVTRGQIPDYLGGHEIEIKKNKYSKFYNIIQNG